MYKSPHIYFLGYLIKEPRKNDPSVVLNIPNTQSLVSKDHYPLKEQMFLQKSLGYLVHHKERKK